MKKFLLITMCALCFAFTASAQFANSGKSSSSRSSASSSRSSGVSSGLSGIRASYGLAFMKTSGGGSSNTEMGSEFSADYLHGFDFLGTGKYILEVGPEIGFMKFSMGKGSYKSNFDVFSISVPVNAVSIFDVGNWSFRGYVGFLPRIHLSAKMSYDSESTDFFKDNEGAKRFQLCIHEGVTAGISNFYFGISLVEDLTPMYSYDNVKMTFLTVRFSVGYNF